MSKKYEALVKLRMARDILNGIDLHEVDGAVDLHSYFHNGTGTRNIFLIDMMQPIHFHIIRLEKEINNDKLY